ncbi:MAG: hypothetical protein Q7W44_02180 [Coriobacteriia bacterium]|nr:hypothetical protein [Coriobacteriia bacterium]
MKRPQGHEGLLPLRRALVVLLVVVAAACAYGSVAAYWANTVLLDTPTFMTAIEPVVRDDGVRTQASAAISDAVLDAIDIDQITDSVAPGLDLPLVEQLAAGFDSLVRQTVEAAVRTDTFANLWLDEMRRWHIGLVGAVRATGGESIAEGAVIRVSLGPYVDLLAEQTENRLVRRLITSLVPDSVRQMRVAVFNAELIADRLEFMRILDRARPYVPWATAVALLLSFVAAPRAWHALFGVGISLVVGGGIARVAAEQETVRIEALMRSAFSASEESAARFAGALFGPLDTWIDYLVLAGLAAVVVGMAAMMWRRRSAKA